MLPFSCIVGTELNIEKLVYGGDGLSRLEGEVIFVPYVLPGEVVNAERIGARKKVQCAELKEVLTASPDRVAPACPVFTRCGGCQCLRAS